MEADLLFFVLLICLYCFIFILFYFIFGFYTEEFLLRGVSIHILVFVNINLINEFIMVSWGTPWGSSFLVQLHVDGMQFYQQ